MNCEQSAMNCELSKPGGMGRVEGTDTEIKVPSAMICELSAMNCELSAMNCELSATNCELSTMNCELSAKAEWGGSWGSGKHRHRN